ncbi:flavin reductase (DIM6/NTAB) family NADH-FMN oxidoreductase RutF [Bradyrhizobium diazoefficiens]
MQDVAPQDYRDAMACLGAAVNIVTTDGSAGRAGFTASAICSVTDDPPTLLVCINRGSSAYSSVTRNEVVCVNVLSARHEPLSRLFGGKVPRRRTVCRGRVVDARNRCAGAGRLFRRVRLPDCRYRQCRYA